jgi:hypothetical protein
MLHNRCRAVTACADAPIVLVDKNKDTAERLATNNMPEDDLSPEQWVWSKICAGETASFNVKFRKVRDPAKAGDWGDG